MNTGTTWSGDEGTRTPNPRLAKAVLYHLSYVPAASWRCGEANTQRVEVASRQSAASACAFLRLRTTTNAPAANATSTTDLSTGHLRSTYGSGRSSPNGRFYEPPAIRQTQSAPDTSMLSPRSPQSSVGLGGLEPPASSLSGMRSNRLSYRPENARSQNTPPKDTGLRVRGEAGSTQSLVRTG